MVMSSGETITGTRAFGSNCLAEPQNSELLYIVIFTIKCDIYSLYIVLYLIWLHLSLIVFNSGSRIFCGGDL